MVIDFEKIAEAHLEGFKGGQGKLDTRNYVDDKVKIMYSTLRPGASTGLHTHVRLFSREEVMEMLEKGEIWQSLMAAPLWKYFAKAK